MCGHMYMPKTLGFKARRKFLQFTLIEKHIGQKFCPPWNMKGNDNINDILLYVKQI